MSCLARDISICRHLSIFSSLDLVLMQKFSFQAMENSRIIIAADHTAADPEDPDHWDKLPRSTRATAATGKGSSSRYFTQDWSDDDSDEDCRMFICPTPLAYAPPATPLAHTFPMPSSAILDDMVVDAAPLNQGPSTGRRAGRKRGVKPQPDATPRRKRQKVGVPIPKKARPVASG
jgi:hypothetical protein